MSQTTVTGAEGVRWDMSELYSGVDDPKIKSDLAQATAHAEAFASKYRGTIATLDAAGLTEAIGESERIASMLARCGSFAYGQFSTNTSDPANGALLQYVQEQSSQVQTIMLFASLEWLEVDEAHAERIIVDEASAKYRHYLKSARRFKPYVLSEAEERILAEKSVTGASAWSRLFNEQTSMVRVEVDGESLPFERAASLLSKSDRDLRRRVSEAISKALATDVRTRAFIFNTLLNDKATNDRLRNHSDWIQSRNLSNEASDESVQALIDAVVSRYDIPHRYYRLKARLLGLDKLQDYDRNASVSEDDTVVGWDDAKSIVMDAYSSFDPRVGQAVGQFFEDNWIDAEPTETKSTGAYCMTTVPDRHPYVFMSYTGDRRSVLVLAHELGHGLHGWMARDLGVYNARTPLTLAETASVFGEALVFGRLLEAEKDPKRRLALLTARMEDAIGTVFRQVAMNRFEDAVHTARRNEGELTVDRISDAWIETQKAVLGDGVELSEGFRIWWSYIPHFISTPGYVYAYAFGYLFSLAIYRRYEKEGASMVDPYLELLSRGGSDNPEELARIVGLDLTDPNFWKEGLEALDADLAEAEKLADSLEV